MANELDRPAFAGGILHNKFRARLGNRSAFAVLADGRIIVRDQHEPWDGRSWNAPKYNWWRIYAIVEKTGHWVWMRQEDAPLECQVEGPFSDELTCDNWCAALTKA